MNLLRRSLSTLRTWLGLGDPSDDHATPSHGWLLPGAQAVVALPKDGASAPVQSRLR
jgi:hypothetical protein